VCEQITQLHADVERMKIDQTRLDQELDFILGQQRELEDMLLPVEQSVSELAATSAYQQHADVEREHTYVSPSVYVCGMSRRSQCSSGIVLDMTTWLVAWSIGSVVCRMNEVTLH